MRSVIVLKVEPGKKPIPVMLELSYESLKTAVSIGSKELANVVSKKLKKDICIIYADDGFLYELEANRKVEGDIICGVFYVVGVNDKDCLVSLTADQLNEFEYMFYNIESYSYSEVLNDWSRQFERGVYETMFDTL